MLIQISDKNLKTKIYVHIKISKIFIESHSFYFIESVCVSFVKRSSTVQLFNYTNKIKFQF